MLAKLGFGRRPQDEPEQSSSSGGVMTSVLEQHPNLSVFHSTQPMPAPSPPSSPSKHGRMNMFKRRGKAAEDEPASMKISIPKRVRSSLNLLGNNSQVSLGRATGASMLSPDTATRPSQDLRSPPNTTRSSTDNLRRPSLDMLRSTDSPSHSQQHFLTTRSERFIDSLAPPMTPGLDPKGSVRSILRDPKTPGTGQNVRFFSRDVYNVMTPDQSMDTDIQQPLFGDALSQPLLDESFMNNVRSASPQNSSTPAGVHRPAMSSRSSRPALIDVFSELKSVDIDSSKGDLPSLPDAGENYVERSEELPHFPPGLDFNDVNNQLLASSLTIEDSDKSLPHIPFSSTPYNGKGKARAMPETFQLSADIQSVDETIFHSQERSPRLPPMLHERSPSFGLSQTLFFSMDNMEEIAPTEKEENRSSGSSAVPSFFSDASRKSHLSSATDSPASARSHSSMGKSRTRALSDTVFQNMLRSSPKPTRVEEDINDFSSGDIVVYSSTTPEPDPFHTNANAYYTPGTPPHRQQRAFSSHNRQTSKEESVIMSLQTQLTLQTELCSQYETDLRARDELVDILGKKLSTIEKEDSKRRGILRAWKKKVAELEKTCRYLEEEVEGSRHESMERSVMDEASSEALRMLHRQIAGLERERGDWKRKEEILREEVGSLEGVVKQKIDDITQLKEMMWTQQETEKELRAAVERTKEDMDWMGNVSLVTIDHEELKTVPIQSESRNEDLERHRAVELQWQAEKEEMALHAEKVAVENAALQAELETLKQHLSEREEERDTYKTEVEAQWRLTEETGEKNENERRELEKESAGLKMETAALNNHIEELEVRLEELEHAWNESENQKSDLEIRNTELASHAEELAKERDQFSEELRNERQKANEREHTLRNLEARIAGLDKELEFANENISRLEANLRRTDTDADEYSRRIIQRENEAEQLREQMAQMKRDHSRLVDDQIRALQEAGGETGEAKALMEDAVKQRAAAEVEARSSKERLDALTNELDRLRRQVHDLQQESADAEVKIVHLNKLRSQDKDDLQGLNIALDSKQQELELLKRKQGVRGTAGSTPAPASKIASHRRRDSAVFSTPGSRPPSVISDSGKETPTLKEKHLTSETPSSKAPLLKSTRINGPGLATKSSIVHGSMGPPPDKPRSSISGTPTPTARNISRSSSVSLKPSSLSSSTSTPRQISTLEQSQARLKALRQPPNASPSSSICEVDEKENMQTPTRSLKRRSLLPTHA